MKIKQKFIRINKKKISIILLLICLILPILPAFSAYASEYYTNDFELPLYGTTGTVAKDFDGIIAGEMFTILNETETELKIKLNDKIIKTIPKNICMVNLPDLIPSIIYKNSGGSEFKINGKSLRLNSGTAKIYNKRLEKNEFQVFILYGTAIKTAKAQKSARKNGETLIIYSAYRPILTQTETKEAWQNYYNLHKNQQATIVGKYTVSWFIDGKISSHQLGFALDLSLGKITKISTQSLLNSPYKIDKLQYNEYTMYSKIHELSATSRVRNAPLNPGKTYDLLNIWWTNKNALNPAFLADENAQKLQKYMVEAGFYPLQSEWWHFNDLLSFQSLGVKNNVSPANAKTGIKAVWTESLNDEN